MKPYDLKAWKKMRECHLATYPWCVVCEDENNLHVHHV